MCEKSIPDYAVIFPPTIKRLWQKTQEEGGPRPVDFGTGSASLGEENQGR